MQSPIILKFPRLGGNTAAWVLLVILATFAGGKIRAQNSKASAAPPTVRKRAVDYNLDIAPIFRASCDNCHGSKDVQPKLRLDSLNGILQGGSSGKVIIPGDSVNRLLVKRSL